MSRNQSSLSFTPEEISALLAQFPKGVLGVDLETTGLSPLVDKIIEIAAVKISSEGVVSTFHTLINPLIDIPEFTIQFHGLFDKDLASAPTIKKPLKDFWEFAERLPVVGHNSSFDLGYLIKSSHDFQIEFPPLDVYDSCRWARSIYKNTDISPENFKLSTLCTYFHIPFTHHVAIEDTFACLKVLALTLMGVGDQKMAKDKSFVFRLSSFDKNECFNYSTRFNPLKDMVQEKDLVELDYRGAGKSGMRRPVRPIGLMPLPKGPVLFAECLLTGMNKSFVLKKIKSYHKLEACLWRPGVSA